MEEGQVQEFDLPSSLCTRRTESNEYFYDQSYEWPWDNSEPTIARDPETGISSTSELSSSYSVSHLIPTETTKRCMRLLVSDTQVLPKSHRLALIDGYSEVQLGRDAPVLGTDSTPRIRLKEMEVSKLHATIYWDEVWNEWGVVDMGSKHGTFLRSNTSGSQYEDSRGTRLSTSKVASVPRRLYHSDQLTIGRTTFIIHIHDLGLSCEECSPKGGDEIPLFPTTSTRSTKTRTTVANKFDTSTTSKHPSVRPREHKAAISQLKRDLLTRHTKDSSASLDRLSGSYVDRSARRRALHPSSRPDAPGVTSFQARYRVADGRLSRSLSLAEPSPMPEPVSQPAAPLPASSIGHMLLVKQGWQPGTALGIAGDGRIDPLDVKASYQRRGLGLNLMGI